MTDHPQRYLPKCSERVRQGEAMRKYYKRWRTLGLPATPHSTRHCPRCHHSFPVFVHQPPVHCEKCRRELLHLPPLALREVSNGGS